ncbi:hypothetical protein HCN44_007778 [Aphidius gifuensis]|uniref:Calpain catalytic domain-containing protein n=1 Tax=Aphidius gifuensis TaxID=684658 RepID=A0A834XP12_APHGI|nr:hypothetical protein HCN44_007778 [Aphidius gifuensis]
MRLGKLEAIRIGLRKYKAIRMWPKKIKAIRMRLRKSKAICMRLEKIKAIRMGLRKYKAIVRRKLEAIRIGLEKIKATRMGLKKIKAIRMELEKIEAIRMSLRKSEAIRMRLERIKAIRMELKKIKAIRMGLEKNKPVLFIENKNNYHVKQGRLGNCWFIVGLINLRYFPNLFEFIVSPRDQSFDNDNYGGIFHFRFWQVGTWVDVVIDDRLPTSERKLITASSGNSNVFWPALVEKAYAKLLYRSYKKLSGGYSKIAMQDLSGCIPEYFVTQDSSNNLFEIMQDAIKRSAMIGCGSISEQKMARGVGMSLFKLKPDHAYAITAVKKVIQKNDNTEFKLIRICNPHGTKSSNPYPGKIDDIKSQLLIEIDGESWILYEDFIEYFVYVDICNLTPNPLTDDLYGKNGKKKLSLSAIEGKWMGGIESKEIIVDDFFKINPQYRMVLKESDEGDKCSILIGLSLKRRHDFVAVDDTALNFNILKFNDDDKQSLPKPLISSSKKSTQFGPEGGWGQVSHRYHLKAGTYYIVPYIYDTFKGGIFYLQILSEQENILEVYDQAIGIPNIRNMVHTLKSKGIEETDAKLFSKMVLTDGMSIDFKGLFSILRDDKFTLNQNCHIAHKLDDEIISEWKVLSETKELMLKKKLSIAKIMEIKLNIEASTSNQENTNIGNNEKNYDQDLTFYVDPLIASINIRKILTTKTLGKGPAIIQYFDKSKKLKNGDSTRRLIGSYITQYVITIKKKFTCYDKKHLARKIAETFTGEDANFWYILDDEGGPGGYFHSSIKNQRHRLKREREVTPPPEEERPAADQNIIMFKEYLESHPDCLPWDKSLEAWNMTRNLRRKDLDSFKGEKKTLKKKKKNEPTIIPLYSVENFIEKWMSLKCDKGPELVHLDFTSWYPTAIPFNVINFNEFLKYLLILRSERKIKK